MMMPQTVLPFQYQAEKKASSLIGFAGLPLYLELAYQSGLVARIEQTLKNKTQGWTDTEIILSLLLLNLAGGDCLHDIERLEQDSGLRVLLMRAATHGMKRAERRAYEKQWRKTNCRGLPSNAALHRYLPQFHSVEEEKARVPNTAYIPKPNGSLQALLALNKPLLACLEKHRSSRSATLDQDATLIRTYKRNALFCYKSYKAYQPLNTYWAEHGVLLHSEFRDGNVNAGYEQLRVLQEALTYLPATVSQVYFRSDSAGYQENLLRYCAEGNDTRFGVIEFAVAAKVSAGLKEAAKAVSAKDWSPIYQEDEQGRRYSTHQEWAEIGFVPDWALNSTATYRYLAIREAMKPSSTTVLSDEKALPFQTMTEGKVRYKLFALVTNRSIEGNALIQWHRERCGKSEQAHNTQKEGLMGGQLPSNLFGVNAAWWQLMVLAFNLSRLMQLIALPNELKESKMKQLRFQVIALPGQLIHHGRQVYLRVAPSCFELYQSIREAIAALSTDARCANINTS